MKSKKLTIMALMFSVSLGALITGCGQTSSHEEDKTGSAGGGSSSGGGTYYPGSNAGNTTGNTGPGTGSGSPINPVPSYSYDYVLTGNTGVATVRGILTDSVLRVQFNPGVPQFGYRADGVTLSGYTIGLNCYRVNVTVLGKTLTAFVSTTGSAGVGYCAGAATSHTLDFSDRLTPGHGPVEVRVSNAQYDNCRGYGNPYQGGCILQPVYNTYHRIEVLFDVFTNGSGVR